MNSINCSVTPYNCSSSSLFLELSAAVVVVVEVKVVFLSLETLRRSHEDASMSPFVSS